MKLELFSNVHALQFHGLQLKHLGLFFPLYEEDTFISLQQTLHLAILHELSLETEILDIC